MNPRGLAMLVVASHLAWRWKVDRVLERADLARTLWGEKLPTTAFGAQWTKPVPRVTGIAAGNDTDQTGETVTAWFGDFTLGARR